MSQRQRSWSRREFLGGLVAGAGGVLGLGGEAAAAEAPPETTKLRLVQIPGICVAPQYVAEELLHTEGFTDVGYVQKPGAEGIYKALGSGEAQISMAFAPPFIIQVDAGEPIVLLAGVHIGCYELFGTDRVRAIRDLKGKTVAVPAFGSPHHSFLATMMAYVGLDPRKDIHFVVHSPVEAMQLLAEGKIDALMTFPPFGQEMRAKKIGHVVVSSVVDRPWSQYFCCIVAGNREFVRKNPVATKRAIRAILKASNICATEPARAAQLLVDKGFAKVYDYALQTMKELPYGKWRDYNPEDSIRFYALRLHEAGMIKSSPQKIIAQGTDWRFLDELKQELKG